MSSNYKALSGLKKEFFLKGLGCANCANKIEKRINKLNNIKTAELNFPAKKLVITVKNKSEFDETIKVIKEIIYDLEPEVRVKRTDEEEESKGFLDNPTIKQKGLRLTIGSFLFISALIFSFSFNFKLGIFITAYLIIGGEVLKKSMRNISRGQFFDENFLMTVATIGAFAIHEFPEAIAVILFYQLGELLQNIAVDRSRRSIKDLMDIKAEYANLKTESGIKEVHPSEVKVGDRIIVKSGERVPLDGKVISGEAEMDTAALTGESKLRNVEPGEEVLSGFINKTGVLTVKIEKELEESTITRILDLVENASAKKAPTEKFITKFARYYTPAVVFGALALAILPPLLLVDAHFTDWIYRALIFLVISCPCALLVSIPLGFFGGIGAASNKGILVKGGNYLEALNNLDRVVFDKTGTLTEGKFEVNKVITVKDYTKQEVLNLAAKAEIHSNHPIAQSILAASSEDIKTTNIEEYEEISGQGIKAIIDGKEVLVGNKKLLSNLNLKASRHQLEGETVVYIVVEGEYIGSILITDHIKPDAKESINKLKEFGIKKIDMLTGDNKIVAKRVADRLGLDNYQAELLPNEKVEKVEDLISQSSDKGSLAFVGDGINDAPVLARADIGVAMGGLGSDAAIEAADIVLMTDEPAKLGEAVEVANYTKRVVWQNIILTLGIKGFVMALGAAGMATMWEAVFADVGVALLAVLNSVRIIRDEK
ncbi:heavy metal translocating P-type ATPase [Sporohalobacter salinus]|uniref:heavy metal translocating P-type ATPase n=1 Tax=Sporohalobacter salinus TaxID=1494606 RepID=UPI0019615D8B|nr:heavy metal translocating P-type ATPase [Sporohalobacter salinus]MBM7625120.1 Cd2+/Zn2+-exporting ATPase [Sporohalobacter salinus]